MNPGRGRPTRLVRVGRRRISQLLPDRADLAALRRAPRKDVFAGLTVAVAALPLSIGFGVASGLGARAGLVTAVVAGCLAAVFGGARLQITGPSGVMAVVLAPIAAAHGTPGVLTTGLLTGLLLLGLSLGRASRYMRCVPTPVVKGFILGAAVVIIAQQVPPALGRHVPHGEAVAASALGALRAFCSDPNWPALGITVGTLLVCLCGARLRPAVPFPLLAVAAATVVAEVARLPLARIGHLPTSLPTPSPGFLVPGEVLALLPTAVTVTVLVALESLMTAAAADALSGRERHDGQRVLFGQGLANLAVPFFGGVAATGTVCRTAINVRSGAVSQLAALTNAAVVALVVLVAAPLVSAVPLAALAGVLIATATRMIDVAALRALGRVGRGQAAIAALTGALTLTVDLVTAVLTGTALAVVLALRTVAASARVDQVWVPVQRAPHTGTGPAPATPDAQIAVHRFAGPLLFTTADRVLRPVFAARGRAVVLDLERVTGLDTTAILTLADVIDHHLRRGAVVHLSGVSDPHRAHLDALGVLGKLPPGALCTTVAEAVAHARAQLHPVTPAAQEGPSSHPQV
ncbi:SulP family inorganic anion transporter [Streptomyces noursei]|uniref:SulP family inorganic anion transporter n=1 Tax=Streptomyces noursei TaxID=1971 RepID=UPI00045EF7D7|nr:SulP family inorganic anion transporter [Streptomyces noursei]AIA01793.1 sulfate transporter [Streptomyces noursei]